MHLKNIGPLKELSQIISRHSTWMGASKSKLKHSSTDLPLRAEILSSEQMTQRGKILAKRHIVGMGKSKRSLLDRLAENESILWEVYNLLSEDLRLDIGVNPAGEWLLDNYYLIEEQIRIAKRHLPKAYSKELPHLENGILAGYPRVYDIALQIISHGDGRIDIENLGNFISAYQSVATLKLGELWAIPIMLRLALIEKLRRTSVRMASARSDKQKAVYWADRMTETVAKDPSNLILTIADMARSDPPLVSSFVAELVRRLQGQAPGLSLPLNWIEQRLAESVQTTEQLVRVENQQQATEQVSISNTISSLRLLGNTDWRLFVESISEVEEILCQDPAGQYAKMDFATRDSYRHVVEKLARRSKYSESEIAKHAVRLAQKAAVSKGASHREAHVGYYLLDKGLFKTEHIGKVQLKSNEALRKLIKRIPLWTYLVVILMITLVSGYSLAFVASRAGLHGWKLWLFSLFTVIGSSHLAVLLVNWLVTLFVNPKRMPRMDFSRGVPDTARTLVTIPTMLTSPQNAESLINGLEVRFLANRQENLFFCLLTDFADAQVESLPQDESLLAIAEAGIKALNAKYSGDGGDLFFLFHRPRLWNDIDKIWMAFERKRGKLSALNQFLLNGKREDFSLIVGDTKELENIRYIITLDTDTQLPLDSAQKFIGAMAHPLNSPEYDPKLKRIVAGYGILQPRVGISMDLGCGSRYSAMCASDPGIDPYTRAVSDVYQDLFGEGSFVGKGIYDIEAFEQTSGDCFPDNRILSHDLLEGCYTRSGLLTDAELYEEYPSSYHADVKRRHRWTRGDWQIAQWVLPFIPNQDNKLQRNPISMLSRWKVFDNLRRSVMALSLTIMLLVGWLALSQPLFWSLVVLTILLLPPALGTIVDVLRKPADMKLLDHLRSELKSVGQKLTETAFYLATMPYEAYYSSDAILRTLWRTHFSHKNMLEWAPSADTNRDESSLWGTFRRMWVSPFLAVSTAFVMIALPGPVSFYALAVLALWLVSPAVAWWFSKPILEREARLSQAQITFLRKLSRKSWAFFETFAGPEDNWLAPDNFQEHPVPKVAHRTSPTNIGMSLLANLTAYDFGTISAGRLIERTAKTFQTMQSMRKHRGHFFNWYDTQSLQPLYPLYISTVDSGNLSGHLYVLRQGLLALINEKIVNNRVYESLSDVLGILSDEALAMPEIKVNHFLEPLQEELKAILVSPPTTPLDAQKCLEGLLHSGGLLSRKMASLDSDEDSPLNWWARAFVGQCQDALQELNLFLPNLGQEGFARLADTQEIPTLDEIRLSDTAAGQKAKDRIALIHELAESAETFAQVDLRFLYDEKRHLFSIGYNVSELRLDSGYYDLLASEARLATFVGIAQGKLPQESWFALGRLLTTARGEPILLSWSGSMFEYLMPLLVMPNYEGTLLDETYKAAVRIQKEYGKRNSVPWGISESGYNAIDAQQNYQYRAFGVPGLGLKRGLAQDLVIAPYATALALMVMPEAAASNLERLAAEGFEARYGFYEAIDYTRARIPRGQKHSVVRSFMAHHQGMSLLSLAYLLLDRPMQKRFEADSKFQAIMLLLQEKVPKATAYYARTTSLEEHHLTSSELAPPIRVFTNPNTAKLEVQLLSNGRYHLMVTNAGASYSRWNDLDITRWREDRIRDNHGTFCYIRDLETMDYWSTAYQPTLKPVKRFEAIFSEDRVEFRGSKQDYDTHMEIAVSPEDDVELRRVRITNRSTNRRTIDVTSYAEVVLDTHAADALHPAFSKLFIQTEIIEHQKAILCTRRPRSENEMEPWLFHLMSVYGAKIKEISYETDRSKFIGRGNTVAEPRALSTPAVGKSTALSGSRGSVLDPIVSIRYQITLDPEQAAVINIVTGVGNSREQVMSLVEKYQDWHLANRVFDLAWTHNQVLLHQYNISEADAQLYGHLASSIIYANAALRADPGVLIKNHQGQSGLWGYAISGDLPIVLLRIEDPANIELARQMIQAHSYWRLKGLIVDLVIWNEDHAGYRQLLHDQIVALVTSGVEPRILDQPGGIFIRSLDQISEDDRILIQTVARIIISDAAGSLSEQVEGRRLPETSVATLSPSRAKRLRSIPFTAIPRFDLLFFNGLGGFTEDGREYVITTTKDQLTPAPWANVLANPHFGTVISESGLSYTWAENAHEYRLTPWNNDPVSDNRGEAFYLRDEERGNYWSPTPLPSGGSSPYVTRHGFGYTVFEHTEHSIRTEVWVYVALDASIKFVVIKVFNESNQARKLSVTGFVEWVLGDLSSKSAMHVVTEIDPSSGAIMARNSYNTEFKHRTAFFDVDDTSLDAKGINRSVTCDRAEFLGRNGSLEEPAAMSRSRLSGKMGAGLDPCTAIMVDFTLAPNQQHEVIFRLGLGRNAEDASRLANRFQGPNAARDALEKVWEHWGHTLGAVNVETPDQALNVLANGWLLYQNLASRLWGRSGFYQSGGAFGFRDQLQDVMALLFSRPELTRAQLLESASRQFVEGDVQHWWHPPSGRGVRTRCSDDLLWLPFVTSQYVHTTGDTGVLSESMHFLEGRAVNPDEDSYYDLPERSREKGTLYEHCVRAIELSLRFGEHGLPLMGSGDWNDGMNLVGFGGKGESVWLGFFLYDVLVRFAEIARIYNDEAFAERCLEQSRKLRENLNKDGWDEQWYRRAYFDDGTPLGSASNDECKIDSIAQSWSVLSGGGEPDKSLMAMNSLDQHLVRRDLGLIQLFDPPFDKSALNPGYIKGYVPGVRENGGQYTHAATWAVMAFAKMGNNEKAWELFKLINPVNHSRNPQETETYKVEPYVMAADVYAVAPHGGRGGWTWYTGSAAWMYRLITESLLGMRLEVDKLYIEPCLPEDWSEYKLHYRYRETVYHITIAQKPDASGQMRVSVDGMDQPQKFIPLIDDHIEHYVEVVIPLK
ncbi:MAG: glucoamylase family protein [Candidatus Cloacimonadaceae bacterium]|jgi:cellobiose phosphorylase|nr:glucoamylase family protein [Candidatus Cloacimonadaceae bacterium]